MVSRMLLNDNGHIRYKRESQPNAANLCSLHTLAVCHMTSFMCVYVSSFKYLLTPISTGGSDKEVMCM